MLHHDKLLAPNAAFIILYRITGQIKPAEYDYTKIENRPMKEMLLTIIILFYFSIVNLYSQNTKIKGRIINEDLDNVPMASILINNEVEVGKTNIDGFFQIEIPVSEKKIFFKFFGLEPTTVELTDKCNEVEVIMLLNITYDFITLKKIDKLRKKRFRGLSKLHKKAFDKDLFKTDKPCYIQEFKMISV